MWRVGASSRLTHTSVGAGRGGVYPNECGCASLIAILRSSREVTLADGTASQDERRGQEAGAGEDRVAVWSHVDVVDDGDSGNG